MKILRGHVSPETAYVSEGYPYQYGLRCRKRWWIERKAAYGYRCVTQTEHPTEKYWNRPQTSRYARYGMALWLDEDGRCHVAALDSSENAEAFARWLKTYGVGVPGRGGDEYSSALRYFPACPYTEAEIERSQARLEHLFGFKPGDDDNG